MGKLVAVAVAVGCSVGVFVGVNVGLGGGVDVKVELTSASLVAGVFLINHFPPLLQLARWEQPFLSPLGSRSMFLWEQAC